MAKKASRTENATGGTEMNRCLGILSFSVFSFSRVFLFTFSFPLFVLIFIYVTHIYDYSPSTAGMTGIFFCVLSVTTYQSCLCI